MSSRADNARWKKDGNLAFSGGCDGSKPAADIGRDQVAFATNAVFRGGPAGPRPGFRNRQLNFSTGVIVPFSEPSGPFQTARFFDGAGIPCLMSSHAGRQFMVNLIDFTVQEITPKKADGSLDINSPVLDIGWSIQAENYWILQDNQSKPIIFNGSNSVRSDLTKSQIPVGNVMAYVQGRIAVALPDRISFRVGDLIFGSSGTSANNYKDAILYFTENNYANEGGDFVARVFGAPSNYGIITMMTATTMTDTQLGQGPLMVGQPNMMFTVQLPYDRTTWKNLANPLVTTTPITGPLGQDSSVLVNTDLWYRSTDGIRTYIQGQRQQHTGPGNTPMSSEIGDVLDADTQDLLEYGSAVIFDNRLLMTVSPVRSPQGVYHRGLAVIDFNAVSGMRGKTTPAWDGIWSGVRILKIVKGLVKRNERCFMYVLNDRSQIEIWEIVKGAQYDNTHDPITWTLEFPSYNCGDSDQFKRLETGRLIFANVVGSLTGTVEYRTDESPCWNTWDSINICAKYQDCGPAQCAGPITYREQVRTPVKLHMPPDDFDPVSGRKKRTGYEFQPRVTLSGYGNLRQMRIYSLDEPESLSPDKSI